MRSLVTGGAGFIGSHLVEHLLQRGEQVVVLDDFSSGQPGNLDHLVGSDDVRLVRGSILDAELVDDLVGTCDLVYHLAAAVGVAMINERPLESLRINIHGTEIVLESAAARGTPILFASTSETYGKNYDVPLGEQHDRVLGSSWKSKWSYAEAKAIGEFMAYSLWRCAGLPAVTVRLFNTVGPRQTGRYGMVVPRFVDQALSGQDLTVYGDGEQSRCFCHVDDVVPAIAALATLPEARGKAVNIGGSEETTIRDLAAAGHRPDRVEQRDRARALRRGLPAGVRGRAPASARHPTGARARGLRPAPRSRRDHHVGRRCAPTPGAGHVVILFIVVLVLGVNFTLWGTIGFIRIVDDRIFPGPPRHRDPRARPPTRSRSTTSRS